MTTHPQLLSVLNFKQISAHLNEAELDAFMSKMWRTVGREETLQLLCAPFINQSNSNLDALTSMTHIASDIIQCRDSKVPPCATLKIVDIPSSLIGEIASYLLQESYCAFSRASRKLYVDCNSPNRLQEMDLTEVDNINYTDVAMERFPQIKRLQFNLRQMHEFKAINRQRFGACNQLQELILDGQQCDISDVNKLINDSSPCLTLIRSLAFQGFRRDTGIPLDRLVAVLNKFRNVTRLMFINIGLGGTLDPLQLSAVCPKITELNISGASSSLMGPILRAWSSRPKINTLSIDRNCDLSDLLNWNLSALKRICLWGMPTERIDTILNANKSLRHIALILNVFDPPQPALDDEAVLDVTKRCIVEQKSLEFLYVSTRSHFETICTGIHRGLSTTKTLRRNQMQITLNVDVREITNKEEFVCSIAKIIHVLGISDIEEWIIRVDANCGWSERQVFDWEPMELTLEDFIKSNSFRASLLKTTDRSFVIGNVPGMIMYERWWRQPVDIAYYE